MKVIPIIILILTIFLIIISPTANTNGQIVFEEYSSRSPLYVSEYTAGYFVGSHNFPRLASNSLFLAYTDGDIAPYSVALNPEDDSTYTNAYLLIRKYDIEKGFYLPLYGADNLLSKVVNPTYEFNSTLENSVCIYSNSECKVFSN